jgi:hypothetical protein
MSKQDQAGQQQPPEAAAKKPYNKPWFRCEKIFETRALSCGKMRSTQGPCHYNRKTS